MQRLANGVGKSRTQTGVAGRRLTKRKNHKNGALAGGKIKFVSLRADLSTWASQQRGRGEGGAAGERESGLLIAVQRVAVADDAAMRSSHVAIATAWLLWQPVPVTPPTKPKLHVSARVTTQVCAIGQFRHHLRIRSDIFPLGSFSPPSMHRKE